MTDIFIYKGGNQEVPKDVTRVHIHQTVEKIPNLAFKQCQKLREVIFPKNNGNLKVIGSFAFMGCTSLELIELPKTTTQILCGAFINCSSAKVLVLNHGLEIIGLSSFRGCSGLNYVSVPSTVEVLQARAFMDCAGLWEVAIEDGGLTTIPESTFEGCDDLKFIGLPPSVTTIGSRAIPTEAWQERANWKSVRDRVKSYIQSIHQSHSQTWSRIDDTATLEEAPALASPPSPMTQDSSALTQDSTDSTLYAPRRLNVTLEDDNSHSGQEQTTKTGNLVVSRQKWEDMSNRLKAAEESVGRLQSQRKNTVAKTQDMESETRCRRQGDNNNHALLEKKLEAALTRFEERHESLQSELQTVTTILHRTITERDELKREVAALKPCLEALKKGFDLLVQNDKAKHEEIEKYDECVQIEQSKKRSRHDGESICSDSRGDSSLGVIDSIKRRILTWSQ